MPEDTPWQSAYRAGLLGEFGAILGELSQVEPLPAHLMEARAWRSVFQWQLWFAAPDAITQPTAAGFEGIEHSSVTALPLSIACFLAERACMLCFDLPTMKEWLRFHETVVDASVEARCWHELGQAWYALASGDHEAVLPNVERARKASAEGGFAAARVDAEVALALSEAARGDTTTALEAARRASRMARAESMPQAQYLANFALARIRRLHGSPHLGARILTGLLRVAPAPWRQLLLWELALAQGDVETEGSVVVGSLTAALGLAKRGNLEGWATARNALSSATREAAWLREDVDALLSVVDPNSRTETTPQTQDWVHGRQNQVPRGLHGICETAELATGFVLASPDGKALRILATGAELALASGAVALPVAPGKQARTESTVAELLLGGPADEDALFLRIYGFAYQPELHKNSRDVLYHRIRKRLKGVAELRRTDGKVSIVPTVTVLVPDPRCSPPGDYTLLLALAAVGEASVKQVAAELGIPARTAHDMLKRLTSEGACTSEKRGRQLVFQLEDTTFSDPTRSGRIRLTADYSQNK